MAVWFRHPTGPPLSLPDLTIGVLTRRTFTKRASNPRRPYTSNPSAAGRNQPFERAVKPIEGAKRDGQYLFEIAGHTGLYSADRVRELIAATMNEFSEIAEAPPLPAHAH